MKTLVVREPGALQERFQTLIPIAGGAGMVAAAEAYRQEMPSRHFGEFVLRIGDR